MGENIEVRVLVLGSKRTGRAIPVGVSGILRSGMDLVKPRKLKQQVQKQQTMIDDDLHCLCFRRSEREEGQ